VFIPATYNNLPVTTIAEDAFSMTQITAVTIPDSVKTIGGGAFDTCTNLTNVTIPSSVIRIGQFAFLACIKLTSVTFATGSNIMDSNFMTNAFVEGTGAGGDTLKTAYRTGKAGTYTRVANGSTWAKQ